VGDGPQAETFFCGDRGAGGDVRLGRGTTTDLFWKEAFEGKCDNGVLICMEMSLVGGRSRLSPQQAATF